MKTKISIVFSIAILLLLTGCNPTKQDIGTLVGAGSGAFIGSQIGGGDRPTGCCCYWRTFGRVHWRFYRSGYG